MTVTNLRFSPKMEHATVANTNLRPVWRENRSIVKLMYSHILSSFGSCTLVADLEKQLFKAMLA